MNHVPGLFWRRMVLTFGSLALFWAGGCSLEPQAVTLRFRFEGGSPAGKRVGGNPAFDSLGCFFVNINGPDPGPAGVPDCLSLAAVSPLVSRSGAQNEGASVTVTPGPNRTIRIIGIDTRDCAGKTRIADFFAA